jgi:hypothetical protein
LSSTLPAYGLSRIWSDAQKRAYVIADNKIADNAIWSEDLLRIEFEGLEALNFDLGLTGFSAEEMLWRS